MNLLNENIDEIYLDRLEEVGKFYLSKLQRSNDIPLTVSFESLTFWFHENLSKTMKKIQYKMYQKFYLSSELRKKEKLLFSNIKLRSKWLYLTGFGKARTMSSNFLTNGDEIISNPEKVLDSYYGNFSILFEDHQPSPSPYPDWWNLVYQENKNFSYKVWDKLLEEKLQWTSYSILFKASQKTLLLIQKEILVIC